MIDLTEFESRAVPLRALGVVVSQNGMQLARKLWDDACPPQCVFRKQKLYFYGSRHCAKRGPALHRRKAHGRIQG